MEILLKDVRGAFLHLFNRAPAFAGSGADANQKLKYKATWIIEPGSEADKQITAAITAVASERWPNKYKEVLAKLAEDKKLCYHRRTYVNADGEPYPGFEGKYRLTTSADIRPTVVDRAYKDGKPVILTEEDGRPYSGCYCNVLVDIQALDMGKVRVVRAVLRGVQFVRDGDALGGTPPAAPSAFADLGVDTAASGAAGDHDLF